MALCHIVVLPHNGLWLGIPYSYPSDTVDIARVVASYTHLDMSLPAR